MSLHRKHRNFTSLSRRCRRKKVLALKNLIHKERYRCGGLFYDECDISQYDNPDRVWGWSDIYFIGRDPAEFWNAEIITAQVAFNDAVESRAFDEAYGLLSEQERDSEFQRETRPDYNANGEIVSHTLIDRQSKGYRAFGGLTFSQYVQKREEEIARDTPPEVHRRYQYLHGFTYGLGLRIIVDVTSLSQQVIEEAITDFRLRGECEWCSPECVSFET
ncbi:MAG TPA: hypothetical protein VJY99_06550 [Buttiauxella sp.]|uniref:hypothetical protein n=1 Tax=Buttiauxella sp. TaxID=1972222 RepID=UPI002B483E60|nr:hypothetical protein [Buttiauxella sp.]HKM96345.1 hypothetical protein [Buttiauxella sp.]